MRRWRLALAGFTVSFLWVPGSVPAETVSPEQLGYSVKRWTVEDGLPANFIEFLTQTPDGYLWWPTAWGVGRFDGVRFRSFPVGDDSGRPSLVEEVFCDSRGRLWVWNRSKVYGTMESGRFVARGESLLEPSPFGMSESPDGGIWLAQWQEKAGARVTCVDGGDSVTLHLPSRFGVASQVSVGAEGTTWLWETGVLFRLEGNESVVEELRSPDGQTESMVSQFFRLPGGDLAVVGRLGVYALSGGEWKRRRVFLPALSAPVQFQKAAADQFGNI